MTKLTNPLDIFQENLFGFRKDRPIQPEILDPSEQLPDNIKDITPDPQKAAVNNIISAYNSADVSAQLRFIDILIQNDYEKIKEQLTKHKKGV